MDDTADADAIADCPGEAGALDDRRRPEDRAEQPPLDPPEPAGYWV